MQFTSLRFVGAGGSAVALLAGLLVGCGGSTTPPPVTSGTAPGFRGTTLTVACGDPAFAREFGNRARAWAGRTVPRWAQAALEGDTAQRTVEAFRRHARTA